MWRELVDQCQQRERGTASLEIDESKISDPAQSEKRARHNVYTLESSFAGQTDGNHFTSSHFSELGESLC